MPRASGLVALVLGLSIAGLLSGCGGAGGDSDSAPKAEPVHTPLGTDPGLAVSATVGYNGRLVPFKLGTAKATEIGTTTEIALVQGTRRLTLSIPTAALDGGDFLTIGSEVSATTATMIYSEGTSRWRATGGTFRVTGVSSQTFGAILAVTFAPDPDAASGNPARGIFTLSGEELFLPYGTDEGPGVVAFTDDPTAPTDAILTPFGPTASDGFDDNSGLDLRVAEWIGGDIDRWNRGIQVSLPDNAAPGDVFPLIADPRGARPSVEYWEYRDSGEELDPFPFPVFWRASSGSCRVVSRTRSHLEVELVGVTMLPEMRTGRFGRGRFRIDGTVRR